MATEIFIVYLGAACLPLNVVENQTRARSSVPAKQGKGGIGRGISGAFRVNTEERKPAILIGTLLAIATSF